MKAIDTIYNNYRFRSRLEARWAVFFDTLGIKYEYEEEGYESIKTGVRYLPDFRLTEYKCWIEIKGQEPTEYEYQKASIVGAFIVAGSIGVPEMDKDYQCVGPYQIMATPHFEDWRRVGLIWSECPEKCGNLCLIRNGAEPIYFCKCSTGDTDNEYLRRMSLWWQEEHWKSPRLLAAYKAARQARFEFNK